MNKKVLLINGSAHKNGNTVEIMKRSFKSFNQFDLVDHKIYGYGQVFEEDELSKIVDEIEKHDVTVIGSPVYWHNMSGMVRNMLDRFYGTVQERRFIGKELYFIFQGAAPEVWMIHDAEYTIKRFAKLYGFEYKGMIQ